MDNHEKKMIAPIIITILVIVYYIIYFAVIISVLPIAFLKIIFGIIPALLSGVMIYVCLQRIKEIKGGEEDDLSKY